MTLTRKQRKAMQKSGKALASLNKQLASGRINQAQYKLLMKQRNELSAEVSGSRIAVISGGLPSLGKRR